MEDQKTRQALVTGGSRGIGKAIVLSLASQGFDVAFTYRSREAEAAQTVLEAKALAMGTCTTKVSIQGQSSTTRESPQIKAYPCDLIQTDAIDAALEPIQRDFPNISAVINNAGLVSDGLSLRYKLSEWEKVFAANVTGAFLVSQYFLRAMLKAREGQIIFIGSIVGSTGNPGQVAYSASKAALTGMAKSLALETASRNIRVNVISPGFIKTELTEVLTEELKSKIMDQIPMKKWGTGEDVAGCVEFLLSAKAQYITGQVLHINGGMFTGSI